MKKKRGDKPREVSCGFVFKTAKFCRETVDIRELRLRKDEFTLCEIAIMFNVELLFKPIQQPVLVEPYFNKDRIILNISDTEEEQKTNLCNTIETLLTSRSFHAL